MLIQKSHMINMPLLLPCNVRASIRSSSSLTVHLPFVTCVKPTLTYSSRIPTSWKIYVTPTSSLSSPIILCLLVLLPQFFYKLTKTVEIALPHTTARSTDEGEFFSPSCFSQTGTFSCCFLSSIWSPCRTGRLLRVTHELSTFPLSFSEI